MIKLKQAIVVEGRYDKNTLCQLIDAPIFETSGFGVMKNRELVSLLRLAAERRGLVILTDSDGAGFVIRNYLKRVLPKKGVLHAYIPDVWGKERRKEHPGKEGKLGVEGMPAEVLLQALKNAGVEETASAAGRAEPITKADLYAAGYSGGAGSAARRGELLRKLRLPEHMSSNALLDALNVLMSRDEFYSHYGNNGDNND